MMMGSPYRLVLPGVVVMLTALVAAAPVGAAPAVGIAGGPASAATTSSDTWSGYIAGNGPFTSVAGTFNVPDLAATPKHTYVYEWVGIDGAGGVSSLIQAGVAETYDPATKSVAAQAWWQVLPEHPLSQIIGSVAVAPGDSITVTIRQVQGTTWEIRLVNNSTGASFTTEQLYSGPRVSADWIVEAPASPSGARLPLGQFSPAVSFSDLSVGGPETTLTEWVMSQGGRIVAQPTSMTPGGFSVAYVAPPVPSVTPTQVSIVTLGQQFALSAANGLPFTPVEWQVSADLVTWSALATATLDASGRGVYRYTPSATAFYRTFFGATGTYGPDLVEVVVVQPSPAPSPSPSPPPGTGGSITGTVLGPDGTPAAGVQVTATRFPSSGGGTVKVAADGTYTIRSLAAGTYHVVVHDGTGALASGYVNGSSLTPYGPFASVITVGGGDTQVNVDVPAAHTISGAVRAVAGPLADIRVYACNALDGTLPYSGLEYCASATTSADGTYSVAVLPGSYTVFFQDRTDYPLTFYSSTGPTLDGAAATRLPVAGSDVGGIDAVLASPPTYASIAGKILTSFGTPRAGISVIACSTVESGACYNANTAADGRYRIRLPAGSYTVSYFDPANAYPSGYFGPGGFTSSLAEATPVTVVSSTVGGIDARLPVGHLVKGVVTGPDGAPLAGIVVTPCASPACSGQAVATGPDGSYSLNLAPGSYVLHFTEWSGLYLSGAYSHSGLASAAAATQVAVGGADVAGIDVALHGISASIAPGVTRTGPFVTAKTVAAGRGGYVTVRIAVGPGFAGSLVDIEVATWSAENGWAPYRSLTLRRVGADGYAYYFARPTGLMAIRAGVRDPVVSALQTAGGLGDVEVFSGSVVARPH